MSQLREKNIINFLKKPVNIVFFFIIYLLLIPFFLGVLIGNFFITKLFFFIVFFLLNLVVAEFIFLLIYKFHTNRHYKFIENVKFEQIAYEPHPYLPFVYKKNFWRGKAGKFDYPLKKNISIPDLTTNNLRYFNGENGDRNVIIPKPKNLIRINCIGASTTGNYIRENEKNYSYPLELEKILKKKYQMNLEVNNFGQGGYNSADLLVRYITQGIDTKPDYIIIYHAYNDVRSYLSQNFNSDYSHSRKNLGEVYWKYYLGSKIPNIPSNFLNYVINKYLFPLEERSTILEAIEKNEIDLTADYLPGLATYERNIQSIIDLSLANNTKVILCTFCIYLYPEIKDEPLHILYKNIVDEENKIIKKLALKNNLDFVDPASFIPLDNSNFLDSAHFTPKGMSLLADCISKKLSL